MPWHSLAAAEIAPVLTRTVLGVRRQAVAQTHWAEVPRRLRSRLVALPVRVAHHRISVRTLPVVGVVRRQAEVPSQLAAPWPATGEPWLAATRVLGVPRQTAEPAPGLRAAPRPLAARRAQAQLESLARVGWRPPAVHRQLAVLLQWAALQQLAVPKPRVVSRAQQVHLAWEVQQAVL